MTASGTTIIGLAAAAAPELNSGCPGSGLLANQTIHSVAAATFVLRCHPIVSDFVVRQHYVFSVGLSATGLNSD